MSITASWYKSGEKFLEDIRSITISIAPYAEVRKIPNDVVDKSIRDDTFEYFQVDIGMNINVPKGKVNEIRFYLTVLADGKRSENAHVLDGFPNDWIQRVNIVNGTIKVGIDNLLKIVTTPNPAIYNQICSNRSESMGNTLGL